MTELIIIISYLLVMILVGVWSRRKAREADDFFVAGRRGSTLLITGSLLATIIGGSAIMVTTRLGFTQGLTGMWWLLVGSIGLVVLGIFFARKVRKFALYTLPELVKEQYDGRVALAASILIVVSWVGIIAAQIIAAGQIMGVLGIGNPLWWMVILSVVFITYTILGGQHAVIRTDTVQTVIIFAGIITAVSLLMLHLGGWNGLRDSLSPKHFAFPVSSQFGGYDLIKLLLLVGLTYVVGPDMYSRIFCARDDKTARKSVYWAALFIIPLAFCITLIGMGAYAMFPQIAPDQAFPTVIKEVLPPFLGGLVLAALLCAFMSSADTTLLSGSTILSVDIIGRIKPNLEQKKILNISKWAIAVLGLCSLAVALYMKEILSTILLAYTIYTAGLILPAIAGFYKNRLKVTPMAALVAIIGGGATALISKMFVIKYLELGGLLVSGLLLLLVSFIENKIRKK
ncbi:sodium:solute symporter [Chloroflexota bacterium]